MHLKIIGALTIGLLAGCVTPGTQINMNKVSVGMTKPEVIAAIGAPDSTAAKDGTEYLVYQLTDGTSGGAAAACAGAGILTLGIAYAAPECRGGRENDFYVRLSGGKVDSYGKVGDFDSTRPPEATINVNKTVTPAP